MNTIDWCRNTFQNEKTQALLEEKIELLLQGGLAKKSEYEKEKAIKSFSEGLGYLEGLLLYQREIHRKMIDPVKVSMNPDDYIAKYQEVQQIMETEIKRQYRHWTTFL